ncbi:N-acetylglucosamine kinase [Streptacidiphilus cavernicola]|uniref:N-acetylglucosamine kinase n=1 Tax=Streptacidiphilus cavernicola TaxID=3342716 RepID=A0ABV6VRN3_9ACTN
MTGAAAGPALVLGLDAGGTGSRALAATAQGEVLGRGSGAGANQHSAPDPAAALTEALCGALAGLDPGRVTAGVLGLAGAGPAGRAEAERLAGTAWARAGLTGRPAVVTDLAVAFAAATVRPDGALLLAGTGAVSALFRERVAVRRCDGYGWLLGDEGSGVWLGREAVRAALSALDGRAEPTALVPAVARALLGDDGAGAASDDLPQALLGAVYAAAPARLAGLAPVLDAAARAGDAVALRIVAEAAERLLRSALALGPVDPDAPFVLAGSLLTRPTLLAARVRSGLAAEGLAAPLAAEDGAAGAAALALRGLGADDAVHVRLLLG